MQGTSGMAGKEIAKGQMQCALPYSYTDSLPKRTSTISALHLLTADTYAKLVIRTTLDLVRLPGNPVSKPQLQMLSIGRLGSIRC